MPGAAACAGGQPAAMVLKHEEKVGAQEQAGRDHHRL